MKITPSYQLKDTFNLLCGNSRAQHSPAETFRCFRWKSSPVKRSATPHTPRQLPSSSREKQQNPSCPHLPPADSLWMATPQNAPYAHKYRRYGEKLTHSMTEFSNLIFSPCSILRFKPFCIARLHGIVLMIYF